MSLPVVDAIRAVPWLVSKARCRVATLALVALLTSATSVHADLVYSAFRDGTWRIYYQADFTDEPQLLPHTFSRDGSAPALAPDKQHVAFEVQGKGILVCSIDDATVCEELDPTEGSAVRPAWNSATGELVFVRYLTEMKSEDSDILITRGTFEETSPLVTQTGIQDYPDVSPNGRLLVYSSAQTVALHRGGVQVKQQLWIMNLETGTADQFLLSHARDIHPRWSPSGEILAFASDRTGQFEICVVNADGSEFRQISSGPGTKTWPSWSPDGRSILFSSAIDGRQGLWLIDADGSNLRPFEPFGSGSAIELRDADWR